MSGTARLEAAAALVDEVISQGYSIEVDGADLDLAGPQKMPDDMLLKVRQLKPAVIAYLTGGRGSLEGSLPVPAEWIEGVAAMKNMEAPRDWPPANWQEVLDGVEGFMSRWAGMAALLNWSTLECFGAHEKAPYARVGAMGLALSPFIEDLAMVLPDRAVFRKANGSRLSHYRKHLGDGVVPAWSLV